MLAFIHSKWGYPSSFAGATAASVAANDDCRKCIALSGCMCVPVCVCMPVCVPCVNPSLICRSTVLKISFSFLVKLLARSQHCPQIPAAIPILVREDSLGIRKYQIKSKLFL